MCRSRNKLKVYAAIAALALLLSFALAQGPSTEARSADTGRYTDPGGFYTVPVPANWTAEARDGYSVLTSPDGRIEVFTLSLPTTYVYANGFGVRELGASEAVTEETLMMIGSTGKTMTTMLTATLVDDGARSWDTPVVEVLPEFRFSDPELIFNADDITAEDVVESLAGFRLFTGFGEAFQYSNQMVAVGGYAAAAADGAAYGELFEGWLESVRRRVLDPIGMDDTLVRFEDVLARENVATPHGLHLDGSYRPLPIEMESAVLPVAPAGAAWSTALDMGRYLITELALGLDLITHGGNTFGFTADLSFLPTQGIGVSILTNAGRTNVVNEAVRTRLFELLYDLEPKAPESLAFGIESTKQLLALTEQAFQPLNEAAVEAFLGDYRNDALGGLTLRLQEGTLVVDVGEFESTLAAKDEAGAQYVATTPPFPGLEYALEVRAGSPVIVLRQGADAYTFERR